VSGRHVDLSLVDPGESWCASGSGPTS
jgi:hypothetical protein